MHSSQGSSHCLPASVRDTRAALLLVVFLFFFLARLHLFINVPYQAPNLVVNLASLSFLKLNRQDYVATSATDVLLRAAEAVIDVI